MFQNQSWPHKELVIVYLSIDRATKMLLSSMESSAIKPVEVADDSELTLGDLRNISIAEAKGDYVCTWDDDDWFHPERLRVQMSGVLRSGKKAGALMHLLMLNTSTGEAFVSNRRLWEASMICERQFILDQDLIYPSVNLREDSFFLKKLRELNAIAELQNPKLYIYCYTGQNTCSVAHFKMLFSLAKPLSKMNSNITAQMVNTLEPSQDLIASFNNMSLLEH